MTVTKLKLSINQDVINKAKAFADKKLYKFISYKRALTF